MRLSLFSKLFGGFFIIIALLSGLILGFSLNVIRRHYLGMLAGDLSTLGKTLQPQVLYFLDGGDYEDLDLWVKSRGEKLKIRITVVDSVGSVLADSEEDPKIMVNHRYRPEIDAAFDGQTGRSLRFSNTVKADMLYVGLPIRRNGEISEVLRLSLFVSDIDVLIGSLRNLIWKIVLITTVLSLLGAFLFSRHLSRPLKELGKASKRIAAGDFETSILVKNRDEMGELAQSFNFMTGQMKNLFEELTAQKEKLNSILASIEEAIVVIDREGRILFSNKGIHQLVENRDIENKFFWEVFLKSEFVEFINKVRETKKDLSGELELNSRVHLCHASWLDKKQEIVVTLYDITDIRDLEKIKRDFVANVSHELRTPLAVIKGYVETLEDGLKGQERRHLDIIKKNTDRITNIVHDLLELSRLEGEGPAIEFETVDLNTLVDQVIHFYARRAENKELTLDWIPDESIKPIQADPFQLEQVLINLIDNALKYTEKGKIALRTESTKDKIRLIIQDTGIGINAKHISRIFERFYVVDKSRSREVGGTGLGLSIVKHIIQLHHGTIDVKSTVGAGTTITIEFPISS